jgi:hypothetical protein
LVQKSPAQAQDGGGLLSTFDQTNMDPVASLMLAIEHLNINQYSFNECSERHFSPVINTMPEVALHRHISFCIFRVNINIAFGLKPMTVTLSPKHHHQSSM